MEISRLKVRVDALHDEAQGIRSFSISRLDGQPFDAYEPGAHIDVTSPAGITRQYSLCGDPECLDAQIFAVKKEQASRGGSRSLHDEVVTGMELSVSAPRNLFRLASEASEHVLIAAGIGITPLLSMAYRLLRQRARFKLHYFARSPEQAAFLSQLCAPPFAEHVEVHLQVPRDSLDPTLHTCMSRVESGAHLYTCGPAPFMERVVHVAGAYLPDDAIHLERFGAQHDPAASESGHAGYAAQDQFEVRLAKTGTTVDVKSGQSIVDALAQIGIEVDTSCGEGVCGTCMVSVVGGEPEHRDHCLSKAERASNSVICCCVSRSRSPVLVLDL
jgi:ferredoxin-NADP reductase